MEERFTFADTPEGLTHALVLTLALRHNGFRTRLTARQWGPTTVHTVRATPPVRPNRRERGCVFGTGR
jgi:hypothetical protein